MVIKPKSYHHISYCDAVSLSLSSQWLWLDWTVYMIMTVFSHHDWRSFLVSEQFCVYCIAVGLQYRDTPFHLFLSASLVMLIPCGPTSGWHHLEGDGSSVAIEEGAVTWLPSLWFSRILRLLINWFNYSGLKVWHCINLTWLKCFYWNIWPILRSTHDKTMMGFVREGTGREPLSSFMKTERVYNY